ncbi:MAG: lipid kinase [Rhizobiaceae bacterium]
MAKKTALLIANPHSRNGAQPLDAALAVLKKAGVAVKRLEPDGAADISPAILREAHTAQMVIVAGGDGTVNAAAKAAVESDLTLGVLPMGTANDLARTLDIPFALESAAQVIATGKTRKIDAGVVNGHHFFNVASIGLASEIAQKLTRENKRRLGMFSYPVAALRALSSAGRFSAEIISKDQHLRVGTLQIAIGNGRFYGGGNAVERDAAVDDGYLDLYSLEFSTVWKMALMVHSFRKGHHGLWDEVRTDKCRKFEIRTRKPMPINVDGEIVTKTPAVFEVLPRAVRVFAPNAL